MDSPLACRLRAVLLAVLMAGAGLAVIVSTPAHAAGSTPSKTTLLSTPNPSAIGESVTITATVSPVSGGGTPTGTVTFKDGAATLGSAPLVGGKATISMPFATTGDHLLTASYAGSVTFAESESVPRSHTVEAVVIRKTWTGAVNTLWSNSGNWNPAIIPASGDTVVLTKGPNNFSFQNDIAGLSLAHVSITGNGYRLIGNGFTLTGTIHADQTTGAADLAVPITLNSGQRTVDGAITLAALAGSGGIKKTGLGELTLASASTYTGVTDVQYGSVRAATPTSLGDPAGNTTVAAGATAFVPLGTITEPFALSGDGITGTAFGALHLAGADHDDNVISGAVSLTGDHGTISGIGTVSGVVSGTKLRTTGDLLLQGANTFTGGVDLASGILTTTHGSGLGTGTVAIAVGGRRLRLDTITVANAIDAGDQANIEALPNEDPILTGAIATTGRLNLVSATAANSIIVRGPISGTGPLHADGFNIRIEGTVANTVGGVTVIDGVVTLAKTPPAAALPGGVVVNGAGAEIIYAAHDQIGTAGPVTVAANGMIDMRGFNDAIGSLTSVGDLMLGLGNTNDFSTLRVGSLNLTGGSVAMAAKPQGNDQIVATGTVALGGELALDLTPVIGTTVTLIDNQGSGPVTGTFSNWPQGAKFGNTSINYAGGDGNDVVLTTPPLRSGYWMVGATGKVFAFGDAQHLGDLSAVNIGAGNRVVDIEPTSDYRGYWILVSNGNVYSFGNAPYHGGAASRLRAGETATSISNDGSNRYWIFTDRGRAIALGGAGHFKDMDGVRLNGPVLGSVATPSGNGYYMVATDGGIFAFGDALFRGSMGGKHLNAPVVGLAPDPDGVGYWLVATDGGIFAFEAPFRQSMGGKHLNKPVIGMVAYGNGYLMVASDGGIFNFSDKPFKGSLGANPPPVPIVAVAPLNEV